MIKKYQSVNQRQLGILLYISHYTAKIHPLKKRASIFHQTEAEFTHQSINNIKGNVLLYSGIK
jgi:hypothetical protein